MAEENSTTENELRKFEKKYEKILSDDPSSVAFIFLAQVLYKQGKVDKAINVLIKGLRYNKKSVTGRFLLGRIYYDRWMIEQAKREFETVVQLAPDNLAACRMLVQIYKSEENYMKALELLRSALAYHPQDPGIPAEIKELEYEIDRNEKREGEFLVAREKIKSSIEAKSVEELESSIKKYDKELLSEIISDIYLDQGLHERACSVLENILYADPKNDLLRKKLEKIRLYLLNKTAGFYTGE